MRANQLLERPKIINETWRPRPMGAPREAAMMARLAIRRGEADLDDVRRETKNDLAPIIGNHAAQHAAAIIVPQTAPEAVPSSEAEATTDQA